MTTAPVHLSYLALPGMVERGYGRIINVASVAGITPGSPGSTLYGGIKSFLIQFSETLHMEYAAQGVHVCGLCPGFTWSEFHDVMETRESANALPGFMWLDAKDVAEEGYKAVMDGKPMHINGWVYKIINGLVKFLPRSLVRRLTGGVSKKARLGNEESAT